MKLSRTLKLTLGAIAAVGLISTAQASSFDVFVTTDQNLRSQQNLTGRQVALIVLPTTRWAQIRRHAEDVADALASIQPGVYGELSW